jgi:carbon-monoxide dehydrogenase large subunit
LVVPHAPEVLRRAKPCAANLLIRLVSEFGAERWKINSIHQTALPGKAMPPAVTEPRDAAEPGAPLVHDDVPGNLVQTFHHGDAEAVAAAFARAAHVTRLPLRNTRIVVNALEPRAATAEFDGETARYTLHLGCQGVFGMRRLLAAVLDVPVERVRVLTGNVGGSFGMKASCYPEYVCLLHAARTLGLPVKWADERSESFLSDSHGRDHDMLAELALDAEGNFLATRLSGVGNLGAYLSNVVLLPATVNAAKNFVGVYRTPLMEVSTRLVFTHTTPGGGGGGGGAGGGGGGLMRRGHRARGRGGGGGGGVG